MEEIIDKIFILQELKENKLDEEEEVFKRIMESYIEEIELLSKIDDFQIEERLQKLSGYKIDTTEYNFYLSNLLYIKQSYFIEEKEHETNQINVDTIKELRLEELIDFEGFKANANLEISYAKLEEIANLKNAEEEIWKEYNVPSTISEKLNVPESNVVFINELSEYIGFVGGLKPAVNYVSRGQKDCTYDLLPSLHRKYNKDYEIHLDIYEGAFKQKIVYYDREIRGKTDEELRAEGQHFGLPTDYLDFTEAHLISLLFAIEDFNYTDQHSIVYFIDSIAFNAATVGVSEKLIDYSNQTVVESMKKYHARSFFVKLGNSNERIHFQKGCFLKVSNQDKDDFQKKLGEFCKVIIIDKDSKKDILKELFNLGITFENIYPDKDNVVKSIKFHYEEMRGGSNNEY